MSCTHVSEKAQTTGTMKPAQSNKFLGLGLAAAAAGGYYLYNKPWKNDVPKDKDRSRTDGAKFPETYMPPIKQEMVEQPSKEDNGKKTTSDA